MAAPVIDLGLLTPAQGFIIQGDVAGDQAGRSVSSAGDINGDGFADLIIGAPYGDNGGSNAGEAYVIFGRSGRTRANIDLTTLAASDGFIIQGDATKDRAGFSVSSAGDLNGDGFFDLIVGAPYGSNGGNYAGEAYVIFGKAGATRSSIDLTTLAASDGFIIQGDLAYDRAGSSVASAGDVNGDGFADLIVGAPGGGNYAGEAYVIFGKAGATRASIDLTTLGASDGFVIKGDVAYDQAGFSVSSAGDINGDGFADLIVGAPFGDNGGSLAGEAYVIFGKAGATRPDIDLTALAANDGFIIQGDAASDLAGRSISSAGDINGDGFADLIVGASGGDTGGIDAGKAHVIFGKAGATRANIDLTTLAASDGFTIQGDAAYDQAGFSVSSAGDINGDGFADLIVSALRGDDGGLDAGEAYVIFGKAGATRANIDLTTLEASDGFIIRGDAAYDRAGFSVSSAGDLNGDGFFDLIVGAPYGDNGGSNAGEAYVIYGRADFASAPVAVDDSLRADQNQTATYASFQLLRNDASAYTLTVSAVSNAVGGTVVLNADKTISFTPNAGFTGIASFDYIASDGARNDTGRVTITVTTPVTGRTIDLTGLTATQGFVIQGDAAEDQAGFSVGSAGDINGDGLADLIVGAPGGDNGASSAGEAYVIFGKAGATRTNIDLTTLAATDGFIIQGNVADDRTGRSVSSAGDINGDGFVDLIVGAPYGNFGGLDAGQTYVIFGKAGATRANIDLITLAASDGFIIQGDAADDQAGRSVASAGDINGDGFADLIVGAPGGDNGGSSAGEAYVIFGKAGATRTNIDLTTLAVSDGFIIQGDAALDLAGRGVSSAGDINGDGVADLIVGAPNGGNGGPFSGEAYVIFGKAGATRTSIDLTTIAPSDGFIIQGDTDNDRAGFSVSSAGDINGDGFADLIIGAPYGGNGGTAAGEAYVIFGKAGATRTNIDLTTLAASDGFIIQGDAVLNRAGRSVSSAGDINGDGFADLIVGAPGAGNAGAAYVIFGKAGATRTDIDLTTLGASDGFIIQGDTAGDQAGFSVSSAGDINGDGFADLIVGAPYGDNGGSNAGEAYVIYGRADIGVNQGPTAAPVTLAAIAEDSGARLITTAELLAGVVDPDGPALTITAFTLTSGNGTLVNNGNGTWSYTPAANDDTAAAFAYTVSDGSLGASSTASLDITPVNDAPVITSNGGGAAAAVSIAENSTAVTTVTSTDIDAGATRTFSIAGGADALRFRINATTGALSFISAPNFEAPTDVGGDNVYNVIVRASDGTLSDTQAIAVTVTDAVDTFTGTALANTLTGTNGADILQGLGGNDTLSGLGGADVLDGGTDADSMSGGAGDDTYFVDNTGDRTIELASEGFDTVFSSVNYNLSGTFIERLELTGTAALSATGNSQANTLVGNDGANVLNGLGGADTMSGGKGDDTYVVDNTGDRIVENTGEGFDTVNSSVSFNLAGIFVERLVLTGVNAIAATGNSQANTLTGNDAANSLSGLGGVDVLDGRGGADTLSGGTGTDTFAFSTAPGAGNIDTISDFSVVDDTIQLTKAIFTGLSGAQLAASAFVIGAAASTADHRIIYNSATGALLFDSDGNGASAAIQFATLATGLALTAADFILV